MATNFIVPIKRLELEFIKSNVTSFDHLIKIHLVKNPGLIGDLEILKLFKVVVDEENIHVFEDNQHLMHYMSNSVYMSESIYMGGLDLFSQGLVKDSAQVTIEGFSVKRYKFLLDYMLNPNDVHLYSIQYRYRGNEFMTPWVISYKPVATELLKEEYTRPAITLRNLRYRGPNEAEKYTDMDVEMICDITRLNNIAESTDIEVDNNIATTDTALTSLYNIMHKVDILKDLLIQEAPSISSDEVVDCKEEVLG